MHITKIIAFTLLTGFSAMAETGERPHNQGWLTYTGAWFKTEYPTNFNVVPVSKSSSSKDGYDGVKFVGVKDRVEFYVYSPQWGGLSIH
jgi:hypothetical protein